MSFALSKSNEAKVLAHFHMYLRGDGMVSTDRLYHALGGKEGLGIAITTFRQGIIHSAKGGAFPGFRARKGRYGGWGLASDSDSAPVSSAPSPMMREAEEEEEPVTLRSPQTTFMQSVGEMCAKHMREMSKLLSSYGVQPAYG